MHTTFRVYGSAIGRTALGCRTVGRGFKNVARMKGGVLPDDRPAYAYNTNSEYEPSVSYTDDTWDTERELHQARKAMYAPGRRPRAQHNSEIDRVNFLNSRMQQRDDVHFIEDTDAGTFESTLLQLCNDEAVQLFYHIGQANYALKIEFSELLLTLVKHPLCERKTLLWVIRMLEKTGLRDEHLLQLKSIHKSTIDNSINRSIKKYNKSLSIKIILGFFILSIVSVSIWYFMPLSQQYSSENELLERKTSFEQFTPDERKKIDSLLHQIQEKNSVSREDVSDFSDTRVNIIAGLKNKKMASIYKDLWLDLENGNSQIKDSCTKFLNDKSLFYENITPLNKRDASHSLFVENGSAYDVLICVFKEENDAEVFSLMLKKGKTTTFYLEIDDHLLFLPGEKFSRVSCHDTSGPSKALLGHFCEKDENYLSMLNEFYAFERPKKNTNKLFLSGDKNSFFTILDLESVLRLL
jgi:hypothetical protein